MLKQELIRHFKSKFTIILGIVLSLIILISYYTTYLEKKEWIDVLHSGASDVNLDKVTQIVAGYNGLYYFETFLNSNDFFIIFCIVLLIGFGISLGPQVYNALQSNYGTMIVSRMTYKKYLKNILLAQSIYMFTFILAFFLFVFAITIAVLGLNTHLAAPSIFSGMGIGKFLFLSLVTIIHMSLFIMITIILTTISPLFLKNKYIVQLFPFLIVMVSYLVANVLGNLSPFLSAFTSYLVIDRIVLCFKNMYVSDQSLFTSVMYGGLYLVCGLVLFFFLFKANIEKFTKDYIL
jgi:hypothetical protein